MTAGETRQAIEAIFHIERARLIAGSGSSRGLARVARNVDLAEELAQDALVIALSEWPRIGVPANPGAWLMTSRQTPVLGNSVVSQAMNARGVITFNAEHTCVLDRKSVERLLNKSHSHLSFKQNRFTRCEYRRRRHETAF